MNIILVFLMMFFNVSAMQTPTQESESDARLTPPRAQIGDLMTISIPSILSEVGNIIVVPISPRPTEQLFSDSTTHHEDAESADATRQFAHHASRLSRLSSLSPEPRLCLKESPSRSQLEQVVQPPPAPEASPATARTYMPQNIDITECVSCEGRCCYCVGRILDAVAILCNIASAAMATASATEISDDPIMARALGICCAATSALGVCINFLQFKINSKLRNLDKHMGTIKRKDEDDARAV